MLPNPPLEGSPFDWEGEPDGILIIHGFSATTPKLRPLAHVLHAAGNTVALPLLPDRYTNPN